MIITGLESTRYYLFNPVWVDITEAPPMVRFNLNIDGRSTYFDLQSHNGIIRFDVGKLVLGLISNVKNKESLLGSVDGAYKVRIGVAEFQQQGQPIFQQEDKYFLLGGEKGYESNLVAPIDLSLTNYAWHGFPKWKSIFSQGIVNSGVAEDGAFRMLDPKVNCDNIFIAFRNNKAGFSYYLFEDFEIVDTNKNKGYYLTFRDVKIPGVDASTGLKVNGKIHRDFYETIRQLGESIEIYAYNNGIFDSEKTWIRLNGGNNSPSFNQKNIATDVSFSFDVITNFNKVY